jgi:hypothetical protein
MADLEYPRWEHHDKFASEIVGSDEERNALLARWEAGDGSPKKVKLPTPLMPPRAAPAAQALTADVKPAFMVYDIGEDANVPLTQERLDDLLFADEMMSILWPAAKRDQKAEAPFSPELGKAIDKVAQLLAARQSPEPVEREEAPKRGRGRPPKAKPDEAKAA